MEQRRVLPIGIQDFEKLRENGCIYVDKTDFVYQLASEPHPYFLSRPRRFGKSLLISTLALHKVAVVYSSNGTGMVGWKIG